MLLEDSDGLVTLGLRASLPGKRIAQRIDGPDHADRPEREFHHLVLVETRVPASPVEDLDGSFRVRVRHRLTGISHVNDPRIATDPERKN